MERSFTYLKSLLTLVLAAFTGWMWAAELVIPYSFDGKTGNTDVPFEYQVVMPNTTLTSFTTTIRYSGGPHRVEILGVKLLDGETEYAAVATGTDGAVGGATGSYSGGSSYNNVYTFTNEVGFTANKAYTLQAMLKVTENSPSHTGNINVSGGITLYVPPYFFGVNFTTGDDQNISTTEGAGFAKGTYVKPINWGNFTGSASGNGTITVENQTIKVYWTSRGTWSVFNADKSTDNGKLLYGYLDDYLYGNVKVTVTVTGLPANRKYAVALILSGDGGRYSPVLINGEVYSYCGTTLLTGDEARAATEWGDRNASTSAPGELAIGKNVMFVEGLSGSELSITNAMDAQDALGVSRLTIAGLQIWIMDEGNGESEDSTVWTNATGDGKWETVGNWSSGVPTFEDTAVIAVSDATTLFLPESGVCVAEVIIDSDAAVTLSGGPLTTSAIRVLNMPALEINNTVNGDVLISGIIGGVGRFTSTVKFDDSAGVMLSPKGYLTFEDEIQFGDQFAVYTTTEMSWFTLVLATENSKTSIDLSKTNFVVFKDGLVNMGTLMSRADGLYVLMGAAGAFVEFNLGAHGCRIGGGNLLQIPTSEIIPPTIKAEEGWMFTGWDVELDSLKYGGQATAQYKTLKPDLHVRDVVVQAAAQTGEAIEINWTLSNTGNPNWEGKLVEQIRLVNVANPENKVVIADVVENVTVDRDGETDRSYIWNIPLKGLVGEWIVEIETAIGSMTEHGGENTGRALSTLTITQCPLPELLVKSITLDRESDEYLPMDTVKVRYMVQNIGAATATAPWQDRLYLFKNGTRITLATREETESLEAGAEVEREITCTIPELIALSGDVSFVVTVDSNDAIVELEERETDTELLEETPNAILGKRLYLSFATDTVEENASGVRFYAKRSGEVADPVTVTFSATGATSAVTYPGSLTIKAGTNVATGMVIPIDNQLVDGTRQVTFTLKTAIENEFVTEEKSILILDNEEPKLTLSFDKTSLREGDGVITVTVTRELVTNDALLVYLSGVPTSQCTYPTKIEIPAGEASYTFELEAVNNATAEILADLSLRASAVGYVASEQTFKVEDDDVPSVRLTIYPEEVSEGAGVNAAYAELSRIDDEEIGSPIAINLTSSLMNQILLPTTVTIPAYTKTVRFAIGAIDNGIDDGVRDVKVTGSIYIESCGCSGQPSSGDVIESSLRIIDNDGPALSLSARPSTMKEGVENAGELILKHNSTLIEDLEVALSIDTIGEIEIPQNVVIPAGETSIRIPIKTLDDGETDGGKLVAIYADDEKGIFAPASTWIQVSDQNLPDLKVEEILLPTSIVNEKPLDGSFKLSNFGFTDNVQEISYSVHLISSTNEGINDKNKIGEGVFHESLHVGETKVVYFTGKINTIPGNYKVAVTLDPKNIITELDEINNTAQSDIIEITSAYLVTVQAEKDMYMPQEDVRIVGSATSSNNGSPATHLPILVAVQHDGYQRTIEVETDSKGDFVCIFTPVNGENGDYSLTASTTGIVSDSVQDEFDIVGIKRVQNDFLVWDNQVVGTSKEQIVHIRNTSSTPLTGIKIGTQDIPSTCVVETSKIDEIPANGEVALTFKLTALGVSTNVTTQSGYEEMYVYISSNEGAVLKIPLYFFGISQHAFLVTDVKVLKTTMVKDLTRYVSFSITNEGLVNSGEIAIELPKCSWMEIVAGGRFNSLGHGETGTVTLALSPEDNSMILNKEYNGDLVIHCENGNNITLPFSYLLVSEKTGGMTIDVIDSLTFTTATRPHVAGATVVVRNVNGQIISEGKTGNDGIFQIGNLSEGLYNVTVQSDTHNSKQINIEVHPGIFNNEVVFLDYQAVSYNWTVVPTEIEDQYEIKLTLNYETHVPHPVMEIHVPDMIPELSQGEEYITGILVENKGFVTIENVRLELNGSIGDYVFEQLSPNIESLPGLSAETIYVKFSNPIETSDVELFATNLDPALRTSNPCLFGILALGEAYCGGQDGINLIARSGNIMLAGILCDMTAHLFNSLSDMLPDVAAPDIYPVRPGCGRGGEVPRIENPQISSDQQLRCECLINLLNDLFGRLFDRIVPRATCVTPIFTGDLLETVRSIFSCQRRDDPLDWEEFLENYLPCLELIRQQLSSPQLFSSEPLHESARRILLDDVEKIIERIDLWYKILAQETKLLNAFWGNNEMWTKGNNALVLLDYLKEKRSSSNPIILENDSVYFNLFAQLDGITQDDLEDFRVRWNSSVDLFTSEGIQNSSTLMDIEVIQKFQQDMQNLANLAQMDGFSTVNEMFTTYMNDIEKMLEQTDVSQFCSKIKLELSQTMIMTREAFEGTLTISNGNLSNTLKNVKLDLIVTDEDGTPRNEYFGISDRSISGFSGTSILDATASLGSGEMGVAKILFVPTVNAAPKQSKIYYFGGILSYYDEILQTTVSTKLIPVPLLVNPSPNLQLDYFIQRDVYADDPSTVDIVEASLPAEFALRIQNIGHGDAKNVVIHSAQPQIIENAQGLKQTNFELKDYTLESTALNGATAHLPLSNINLGTIKAETNTVAQWWFTSGIEGHFSGVAATLTHLNSWGNPDTSLIGSINTHRLVRSLTANEDALPDFLTSEDLFGAPTELYLSSGEVLPVYSAVAKTDSLLVGQNCSLQLTIHASEVGWNYASINLLNASLYTVEKVERDGVEIDSRSVWITDRTFRDGLPKLEQELMHIAASVDELGEHTYTIHLRAKPSDVPEVKAFNIESGMIEYVARESVIVEFSKVIEPSTFTVHDLTLLYQGHRIDDLSSLTINCLDDTGTKFVISGLSELCKDFGRYELIVQCAGISDVCGQLGVSGMSVAWILSRSGAPYILDVEGRPVKRVQQLDGVTTVFSLPVTEDSVKQCVVTLNGIDVSKSVTILPADDIGTRFKIEGLNALQLKDGDYTLIIDGTNLMGVNGEPGIGSYELTWARDTTNPELTDFRREKGLNGTLFNLKFTEDVTITSKNIRLTHKADASKPVLFGGTKTVETLIELPATAKLTSLSNGDYVFSGIDSVILEEGTYTLTVDLIGVTDEAGNLMSGERSITWTVDTTAPCEVANLEVSSSHGTLDTCIYTANEALTIRGTVPERELQVQIFAKYIGGDEILLAEPEIDEYLQFVANLSLPGSGNVTVIIRLTDAYGNSTDTIFDVYVDVIDLVATISGMPESTVADELTITFLNGVPDEVTVLNAEKTLTLNDVEIPIPDVVITKMADDTYVISGLSAYTTEYGTYKFSYDVRSVKKLTSGVTGNSIVTVSWANIQQDTIPPTVTSILFDGKMPEEAYVTNQMFNEVTIRFSEEVNIENLIALGLASQVFSIHYLSDTNDIVGTLNAKNVMWNGATHSAHCLFDGDRIPCGKARFVIDSSLITDGSGNKLAMTDVHEVISAAKVYTPSLLKQTAAYAYACPTLYDWNNDGLLDLLVGEKTVDMYGKVRIYLNRGTATSPNFDDYTYLKRDGKDVAFQAQGCVGMQVSFYDRYRAVMILADSSGKIYSWDYLNRNPETNLSYDWELLFDHSTDERFSNLIRTQTSCCDFDDDGEMEIIVSGQNSPMFWMEQEYLSETEEVVTKCTPIVDIAGNVLLFPEGQRHTSAVLTDVNGDAIRDLVTGDSSGNVWVYYGTNDKRFMTQPVMIYQNPESANSRSRLTVGDLNGDGIEDLLVGRQDGSIVLLEGKGNLSPAVNFKCVAIKTIEDALNNYIYWIDGAQGWICEQFGEDAQAKVSHDANGDKTILSAKFMGRGTVVFTWAVTGSAQNSTFKCIGGDSEILRTGPFSLITQSVSLSESRTHTLSWIFEGKNDAIIKGVSFIPFDESEQVTKTSEVPIPFADIHQFANAIWKQNEGDYEKAVHAIAANGKTVMDNCIAGVDSSDALAHFYAKITMTDDGEAKISWHPALNGEVDNEGVANGIRTYKIYGKETLEQNNWSLLTPENRKQMFFFKVTVEMP